MLKRPNGWLGLLGLFALATIAGCSGDKPVPPPPTVTVAIATTAKVPVTVDYVGMTAALESVQIRARVEGYLLEKLFRDGQDIAQNDLLFVLQQDQYRAALEQAEGEVLRDQAQVTFAREQVERYAPLVEKEFITRESFDETVTRLRAKEANLASSTASLAQAGLNLNYTEIRSPIDGRIGRSLVDVGNLVGKGIATLLTTVVQLDPIYIYFSPTDADLPQLLSSHRKTPLVVRAILPGTGEHPEVGLVDFIDNQVNANTATIQMRARIPNPSKILLPGQFAKVRLLLEILPDAILVPEQALVESQGGFTVFIVNSEDTIEARSIEVGPTIRGQRVITKGIKTGERVMLDGLTRARNGAKVHPKVVATSSPKTAASPQPKADETIQAAATEKTGK